MDDKIINNLDNLNEEDTEQLIGSIDTDKLGENIDMGTTNRIKASVMEKAGLDVKIKTPLIPNKLKFVKRCLLITLIELMFFTAFAFIGWAGGITSLSGFAIGSTGVVPFVLYIILFSGMSLFVYLCMYNIDGKHFSLRDFLPKNRALTAYFFYMYISAIFKIILFIVLTIAIESSEIIDFLSDYLFVNDYLSAILLIFAFYVTAFAFVDMILFNFKNFIVLHWQNYYSDHYEWQFDIKAFLLEFLKYGFIACAIIVTAFTGGLRSIFTSNFFITFLTGIVTMWLINALFSILVLMKKRHYLKKHPPILTEILSKRASDEEDKDTVQEKRDSKKWIFGKQRAFVLGASAIACVYAFASLFHTWVWRLSVQTSLP